MSYRETYDSLCVLLEEYSDSEVETVADQIMALLALVGEDNLEALDPPQGLQHWLLSHGLSLVTTSETRSLRVWEAAQDQTGEQEDTDLEGEQGVTVSAPLQIGDYVEYRTASTGPHHQSQIGSGYIKNFAHDTVEVEFSPGGAGIILFPESDFIQVVRPAGP